MNIQIQSQTQPPAQHKTYSLSAYRYVNLLIFLLVSAVNCLPSQAFSSINRLIQQRYHYSAEMVTLCSLLGAIAHPFVSAPCNWILDKFGTKIGCSIGGLFVIAGTWVRLLMDVQKPEWAIIGAILISIGSLFVLSSPSAFAIKWFDSSSLPKVISGIVLVNSLSSGLSASIAGVFLPENSTIQQIKLFLLIQAIIITVPFILFFLFFRQAPLYPPSKAAANVHLDHRKQPYILTIKNLIKNQSYMKTILGVSFSYGIFISYISLLNESLATLGYKQPGRTTSFLIISALLMGIISTFLVIRAVRMTLGYRKIISICLLGSFINFGLNQLIFLFGVDSFIITVLMGVCVGFFVIPITALYTAYSVELTYPIAQGSATGYLFAASQTFAFLLGMLWITILDGVNKWKVYLMFGVHTFFIFLSLLININTKELLKKTNYELGLQNQEQMQDQSQQQNVRKIKNLNKETLLQKEDN